MHKITGILLLFFVYSFLVTGCKKDVDDTLPTVTFLTPSDGQAFSVFQDIHVTADITDDTKLESVTVSLEDSNYHFVHTTVPLTVSSFPMHVDMLYYLNNIHLESGFYFIRIDASDGRNIRQARRRIYINAVPRRLTKVVVTTIPSASQTDIAFADSAMTTAVPYTTISGDHLETSVSSYYQYLFHCGSYTGNHSVVNLADNSPVYSVSFVPSINPYFTSYAADDQTTWLGRYDGFIQGYQSNGALVYSATTNSGYYPQKFCFNSGYLITEEKYKTSPGNLILVTHFPSGAGQQQLSVSQEVVQFCEKDASNVFLFGNTAGQGTIQLFDRAANSLWNPYPFALPPGSIQCVFQVDADTYLLGYSDGNIYKYEYQISSITTFLSGYNATKLVYDNLYNDLYIVEAHLVTALNLATLTVHHSLPSAAVVADVDLLYNR